jgi:hypothetical protein
MSRHSHSPCSIDLPMLLFVVFLVLKLCGVIDWSWVWVTAPLWLSVAIPLSIFLVFVVGGLVLSAVACVLLGIGAIIEGCYAVYMRRRK